MRITASKLPIARHCLWAFRPDVKLEEQRGSAAATAGQEFHEIMSALVDRRVSEWAKLLSAADPEVQLLCKAAEEWWLAQEWNGAMSEVAYAFDVATRKVTRVGRRVGRVYPEGESLIPGSSDISGVHGDAVRIVDWKTGFADHVEPAKENRQLRFLALCEARLSGLHRAIIEIAYVRPGKVWVDRAELDLLDLAMVEEELVRTHDERVGAEAHSGDHCRFCPGLGHCPATTGHMVKVDSAVKWSADITGPDHAAAMAYHLPSLKKAVDAVSDALKAYVRTNGPLDLQDGKVYKEITKRKTSLNLTAVKAHLGAEVSKFEHTVEYAEFRAVKR